MDINANCSGCQQHVGTRGWTVFKCRDIDHKEIFIGLCNKCSDNVSLVDKVLENKYCYRCRNKVADNTHNFEMVIIGLDAMIVTSLCSYKWFGMERNKTRKSFDANLKTKCSWCNIIRDNMKKCSRCRRIYYCNTTCQRNDWKNHKIECEPINKKL